jgi:hypothetical protein
MSECFRKFPDKELNGMGRAEWLVFFGVKVCREGFGMKVSA